VTGPIEVLSPAEVAALLKVNHQTVREWIKSGTLRASKIGGRLFIRREWIDELLDATSQQEPRKTA